MSANGTKSSRGSLVETYAGLPRAMKWLVWLVLGLVLYLAVLEPVIVSVSETREQSEQALADIERYSEPDVANRNVINDGRKRWGDVLPPGTDQARVLAAKRAINDVLVKHDLTRDVTMTERSPTKLKTDGATSSVEYWRGPIEVKFSAKPHVAMAVIGELEMVPSIAQLASIRIRRQTDRAELEVTLVADAWFVK